LSGVDFVLTRGYSKIGRVSTVFQNKCPALCIPTPGFDVDDRACLQDPTAWSKVRIQLRVDGGSTCCCPVFHRIPIFPNEAPSQLHPHLSLICFFAYTWQPRTRGDSKGGEPGTQGCIAPPHEDASIDLTAPCALRPPRSSKYS